MRKSLLGTVLVAGVLLGGCTHSTTGSGTPTAPGSPTAASSSSASAAPQVANPLEVSKFEQNPCGLLSAAQASQLFIVARTVVSPGATSTPICGWENATHDDIDLGLVRGNGLSDAYGQHSPGDPGYFIPITSVGGYPGIYGSVSDNRDKGVCTILVGVRNDEVLTASSGFNIGSPNRANPCPVVLKAAELAVATLKGGS